MAYPTTIDDFTNPASGDPLNSPSHSQQHTDLNNAVEALQAKVGADSSVVTTSHDYKLSDVTTGNKAESSANKVTSISGSSTDVQYPSAKAVNAYTNLAPTDLKISTASKGGVLRNIDGAVGDIAITSSGWIEDEKFGWYASANANAVSAEFDSAVTRTGRLTLKMSTTDVTGKIFVRSADNDITISKYGTQIKPNTYYKFSCFVKNYNGVADGWRIQINSTNTVGTSISSVYTPYLVGTNDWTLLTVTFLSASTAAFARIVPQCLTAGNISDAWFDVNSMTLEEVVEDTTYTGKTIETVRPVLQAITSTDNIDQSQVSSTGYSDLGNATRNYQSQQFIPTKKYLTGIVFRKRDKDTGTFTGDVTVSIRTDNSDEPSTTILASKTYTNAQWNALSNDTDIIADLPCILTGGTKYWFVIGATTSDASNYSRLRNGSGDTYTSGLSKWSTNGTSPWTTTVNDLYFKTIYAKKAENFTVISNGIKTDLKADKDGLLSNSIIDFDNGKYRYTTFNTSPLGERISDLYSHNFGGNILTVISGRYTISYSNLVFKVNTILPIKGGINISGLISGSGGAEVVIMEVSKDNITYTTLDTTVAGVDGILLGVASNLIGSNVFYIRFTQTGGSQYLNTLSIEADIDTSSVPQGLFYPLGVNQFAETWKATNTVRSYVYRQAKYTNEYGVVMPAIELNSLTNGAGTAFGYIPLKIDNSQETTPAITILASSGVASDTVLNTDGGYVALATGATEGKIDYNVTITKNTYYLSSNADSSDSTQDPSHQQNVILGVRQQGLIQSLGDTKNTIADIKKGLADTKTLVQNGVLNFGVDTGTTDDYAISIPNITSYQTGMRINFKATTANTDGATLNINDLGAKAIVKGVSTALSTNDILAGMFCEVIFDGTNFVLLNPRAL